MTLTPRQQSYVKVEIARMARCERDAAQALGMTEEEWAINCLQQKAQEQRAR